MRFAGYHVERVQDGGLQHLRPLRRASLARSARSTSGSPRPRCWAGRCPAMLCSTRPGGRGHADRPGPGRGDRHPRPRAPERLLPLVADLRGPCLHRASSLPAAGLFSLLFRGRGDEARLHRSRGPRHRGEPAALGEEGSPGAFAEAGATTVAAGGERTASSGSSLPRAGRRRRRLCRARSTWRSRLRRAAAFVDAVGGRSRAARCPRQQRRHRGARAGGGDHRDGAGPRLRREPEGAVSSSPRRRRGP